MDVISSKVMAVMASETLASEATLIASSDVVKEIGSDLSELAEGKKDDTPKNIARIYKVIEANQVVKSSESQGDSSKEKGKSQTSMILFLVGVAVTLSISTIYFTKQGKKAGK